jgi:DNA-binding NarL/FixJ family response regulator
LAYLFALRGDSCDDVAELVERGWDNGRFLAEESCEAPSAMNAVWALIYVDELDRAHVLAEAMLADAQTRGSVVGFQFATGRRGIIALRRGALAEAEADTRAAFEFATDRNLTLSVPIQAASLGLTLLERGQSDQAMAVVEAITLSPTITGSHPSGTILLEARGRIRLACGHREQAIADLRQCGQLADRARLHNPNFLAWRSALALALAPQDPQQARELAQEELELARHVDIPRAIGIALRVCGLLSGRKNGIELLEQSVAVLEHTPMQLELAHSLTALGGALRRAGARTTARQPLRRALDLAARCGAAALAQRARDEALAAGARPRRPWTSGVHALTPSELRVARLAAQCLGNREIAQALFITTKTVSDHLTSAYRKLGISSRNQLATAITAPTKPDAHT